MEVANPPAAAAVAAPSGTDWRSQLHPMAREVMAKQIMKTLRNHIPVRDSEGLNRLQNIAKGFEEKFYNSASTQSSYLWKIASLLRFVEAPNHNPNHQGPGLPPQGNSPAQSSATPLMSQQKTQRGNVSASVQAYLPDPDGKGKAPMSAMRESPGDEPIGQEYWDNILFPRARDDEPQHPATDTPGPSENIQIVEAADPVFSDLPMLECSRNKDTDISFDMTEMASEDLSPLFPWIRGEPILEEEGRNYMSMVDGTTNLKKRKFDGASSPVSVFGKNTSGPVEDHSSSPAPTHIPDGTSRLRSGTLMNLHACSTSKGG